MVRETQVTMITQTQLESLYKIVDAKRVITDPVNLVVYEIDAAGDRATPDAVVFPQSVEEIAKIVRWASAENVPIVARGAGTGLSGGCVAEHGGIVLEFSNLGRVLEFDTVGRSVVAQAGTINLALDAKMKTQGLYYPPDPASGRSSTLGGNVAENAGGPHCFKYGVTSNYITGLCVVLADGRIVRIGGRAIDYPGYDFLGLVTGSEGTLAIIDEISARLLRNPPGIKTMMAAFDSVAEAGKAVSAVIASGVVPATMEMMDRNIMRIVEDFVHPGLPVESGAALIIEVDGYPASLDSQMDEVARILEQNGGQHLHIAQSAEERDRLWYGRKSAAGAMARLAPAFFLVDGTVPRSQLAETLDAVNRICKEHRLQVGYVFHAGDGNLHPFIPYHPSDADEVTRGWQASECIMRECVAREGSITGEHGVGIEKREFMKFMFDGAELAAMWDIKQVFDSKQMFNPGKIFPKEMPVVQTLGVSREANPKGLEGDVFAPTNAEETAAGLAEFTSKKIPVSINQQRDGAVTLSTKNLRGIQQFAPDDLYITLGAGTPLCEAQEFLAEKGWQIPLASPWREMSVGTLVASNLNAPMRMRYGSVRDVLLCGTVVLADGRIVRTGRALVKNVAGYDLTKLLVGMRGTLGVITDVTMKIVPCARAKRTLLVPVDDLQNGIAWSMKLLQTALVASAITLSKSVHVANVTSPFMLAYTAEGVPEDVATELTQVREVLRALNAPQAIETDAVSGTDVWCDLLGTTNETTNKMMMRIGVAPKDLADYVRTQANAFAKRATFLLAHRCGKFILRGLHQSGIAQQINRGHRHAFRRLKQSRMTGR